MNVIPLQPNRPTHISEYAELCLQALAEQGLGDKISLGGAFGLLHYLDYRDTHDVDAWWDSSATAAEHQQVIEALTLALQPVGEVRKRTWGDVVSIELLINHKKVFSFQIAQRSVQLQPATFVQWTTVPVDSFDDLLASKMVALVDRGAPRDFRDIYTICQAGLATPAQCWALWRRRQAGAGHDADLAQAHLAVETHLERIEQHRPLTQIVDPSQREQANDVRQWFRNEFLDEHLA